MSVMFEGSINKVLIAALLLSLLTPFLLKLRNRKHAALLPEGPRPGWKTDLFAGIGFLAIAAASLSSTKVWKGQPCLSRSAD